ncbi:MAG TPA: sulfide/dihydroorotate dehydrogenase-like FAD/NAD-binding protein [Capsulimonadaceae bacterium]
MFEIVEATFLSADVKLFRIVAPRIARKQQAGQFVILRVNDTGERIPITIAGSDPSTGTITIIVQGIGKTTKLLNELEAGGFIQDVVGPLGKPSEIKKFGNAIVVGGGVGTAIAYPIAKALQDAGNYVTTIVGARTKDLIILEEEMSVVSDAYWVTTDDGSHGDQGLVTERLQAVIDSDEPVDYVLAIGPIPMMRAVAETTRPYGIPTVVSLNAIMVDGTGMCGGCRVTVGGKSEFACVDGPEFDAHLVDFKSLQQRSAMYREMERVSLERFNLAHSDALHAHTCRLIPPAGRPLDTVYSA